MSVCDKCRQISVVPFIAGSEASYHRNKIRKKKEIASFCTCTANVDQPDTTWLSPNSRFALLLHKKTLCLFLFVFDDWIGVVNKVLDYNVLSTAQDHLKMINFQRPPN